MRLIIREIYAKPHYRSTGYDIIDEWSHISTFFFAYKPVHKHELVRWSASMAQKQTIIDETKVLNPKAEIQLLYKRYEHTSNLSLN